MYEEQTDNQKEETKTMNAKKVRDVKTTVCRPFCTKSALSQ